MTKSSDPITTIDELVDFMLYGDIDEMPLSVLGDKQCDDNLQDDEQNLRQQVAACIIAWSLGRLSKGGHFLE